MFQIQSLYLFVGAKMWSNENLIKLMATIRLKLTLSRDIIKKSCRFAPAAFSEIKN